MPSPAQQRDRLLRLLKQLFQLDQPDLDFGFYRIMHAKAERVTKFLDHDLLDIIRATFGEVNPAQPAATRAARQKAQQAQEQEADIYNHLYRFFERYYDNGDFMSRRYFTRETDGQAAPYAVPYDGREVHLHWANRDQYYIKTSEYLTNFTFDPTKAPEFQAHKNKLAVPDIGKQPLRVHCRVVAATEGEHNNLKASAQTERYFILHAPEPIKLETGDRDQPELVIQFQYRADPAKTGQEGTWRKKRLAEAADKIKTALPKLEGAQHYTAALLTPAPTEPAPDRTLLEKYLAQYTARNTMDYFIHKDLGGFLRRELDFYIKNEIMRLDDIESAAAPHVESYLEKIRVIRRIAKYLIDFLAQLEDFQKRLWLKKKFVTETQYCITLDRIPPELYPQIAANAAQRQEWVRLFWIEQLNGYSEPLSLEFLKANPFLVLDTAFFSSDFKDALLASMPDLDENLDGLLIHSENFQALELMQEKYKEQIKCAHIDPPYNTQTSGFSYKNGYKHSSWLSMMSNRFACVIPLLNEDGSAQCHIDENEYENLYILLEQFSLNNAGTVIWDKRNPMNGGSGVATQHEYIVWKQKNTEPMYNRNKSILLMLAKSQDLISSAGGVTEEVKKKFAAWVSKSSSLTNGEKAYRYIDNSGKIYRGVSLRAPEPREDEKFHRPLIHPITRKPCAMPPNGFSRTPETLQAMIRKGDILFGSDETTQPQQKMYLTKYSRRQFSSLVQNAKKGKADTGPMKIDFPYCHPVSLYEDMIGAASHDQDDIILDYFAGSGTTGHAVVNLNREDGGKRKYILVEMGDYFDTVTRPRMQKIVYSKDWKDGKPVSRDGLSHAFKYIRLESYEDTLNNLAFNTSAPDADLLQKTESDFTRDYMLRYWLDCETKGSPSLLNIEWFVDPTAYKLKIKKPGTDEYIERAVDLIETFNWLLGMHVQHLGRWHGYAATCKREPDPALPDETDTRLALDSALQETAAGPWHFRKVEGYRLHTPGDRKDRERVLIIWRKLTGDIEKDNLILDEWFRQQYPATQKSDFDLIYVNGSNNLANLCQPHETWQVRLIEEAFHQAMWSTDS
ncbi:MAG: site-specific DNA-methyltransferase [Cellvibrionales bacterium]|nr:site-specific DNA-methyltransferase [Cellvibrionales bacterium]